LYRPALGSRNSQSQTGSQRNYRWRRPLDCPFSLLGDLRPGVCSHSICGGKAIPHFRPFPSSSLAKKAPRGNPSPANALAVQCPWLSPVFPLCSIAVPFHRSPPVFQSLWKGVVCVRTNFLRWVSPVPATLFPKDPSDPFSSSDRLDPFWTFVMRKEDRSLDLLHRVLVRALSTSPCVGDLLLGLTKIAGRSTDRCRRVHVTGLFPVGPTTVSCLLADV